MRKYSYKIISLIFIQIFTSCYNEDAMLTDYVEGKVIPLKYIEFVESGITDVLMTDKESISGFTRDFYFYSNNFLNDYNKVSGGINSYSKVVYSDENTSTLFVYTGMYYKGELSIIDRTMDDNPVSTKRFTLLCDGLVSVNGDLFNTKSDFKSAFFISKSEGWIVSSFDRYGVDQSIYPRGIRVYRVNGNFCSTISYIAGDGLDAVDIVFKNKLEGFIIAKRRYTDEGFIYKTLDGGVNWSQNYTFDYTPQRIILLDNSNIVVESSGGYLKSVDNGARWTFKALEKKVKSTIMTINGILYSIEVQDEDNFGNIGSLLISKDNGDNWQKVNGKLFYGDKIYFYDSLHGVAYSRNILQYTNNGGKSWKLLIFPIKT